MIAVAVEGDGAGHVADEDDGVAEDGHWSLRKWPKRTGFQVQLGTGLGRCVNFLAAIWDSPKLVFERRRSIWLLSG